MTPSPSGCACRRGWACSPLRYVIHRQSSLFAVQVDAMLCADQPAAVCLSVCLTVPVPPWSLSQQRRYGNRRRASLVVAVSCFTAFLDAIISRRCCGGCCLLLPVARRSVSHIGRPRPQGAPPHNSFPPPPFSFPPFYLPFPFPLPSLEIGPLNTARVPAWGRYGPRSTQPRCSAPYISGRQRGPKIGKNRRKTAITTIP